MKKVCFLASVAMMSALPIVAQKYQSQICNADGTVTFQYRNDKAKDVQVDVQFAGRNVMKKDAKTGLWTVTLGPAAPDMYPYCFVVDGVSVMDPMADQYFPNEGFKNSLLEIPAPKGALPHDIKKNVPHGKVDYIRYYSKALGGVNNAIVYLPPSYDKSSSAAGENKAADKRYPVFYLISGTTDTEEVYYKVGRMNYILDNLLAEGKAKEMIIVLPYGNPTKLLTAPAQGGGFGMMRDVVGEDITGDLMNYVESHYRTINDADHRAIGGFSRGGNQGLGIGLRNLDKFSYLCSYSSFTSTDIPVYNTPDATNSKINLFWLGVGTDDFLYGNARDYMQHLDDHKIRAVKEYTTDKFGHTWMNAKFFLHKTMQLLFNKEASRKAMDAAQPTKAKTGEEQQFTPGVMARLFPRQVVSPEWKGTESVTLRINAPEAKEVKLEGEMLSAPAAMQKDADGVWSVTLSSHIDDVYKYCFVVDGTQVADPTNMYLSPDKGFKYSILANPGQTEQAMGEATFGKVTYDLNSMTATYGPNVDPVGGMNVSALLKAGIKVIQVVPGKDDTIESWFKVGQVNLIADRLIAEGKSKAVIITTQPVKGATVIKADDYKTWKERREAVRRLIVEN